MCVKLAICLVSRLVSGTADRARGDRAKSTDAAIDWICDLTATGSASLHDPQLPPYGCYPHQDFAALQYPQFRCEQRTPAVHPVPLLLSLTHRRDGASF